MIETIVSNVRAADVVECFQGGEAQNLIDAMDEARHQPIQSLRGRCIDSCFVSTVVQAMDSFDFTPRIRKKCVKSLYKMCARHTMLPKSLHFKLHEGQIGAVLRRGGSADVSKLEHRGQEVAVKVLRSHGNIASRDMINVGHRLLFPRARGLTKATSVAVLQGGHNLESSSASKSVAIGRGDDDRRQVCYGIWMDGKREHQ